MWSLHAVPPPSSMMDQPHCWLGPETVVSLKVEGHEVNALTDSGSQVNTVMPGYVHQHEFPSCH